MNKKHRKTRLKADRDDWGGSPYNPRKTHAKRTQAGELAPGCHTTLRNQRNPGDPSKINGNHINTHHNSSRNHQGSSRISQNHFLIHFATKSNTPNPKGTVRRHTPGALIEVQSPNERITHAGTIRISRFGHTPQPPIILQEYRSKDFHIGQMRRFPDFQMSRIES